MKIQRKYLEDIQTRKLTLKQIRAAIPEHLFKKDELRFLVSVGNSVSFTIILMYLGRTFIPQNWLMLPIWIIYALATGTVWFGCWILAHECGHGTFSNNKYLNDILGYLLHTPLMVPYFAWQHSHAIHHAKTNHIQQGESHCPSLNTSPRGQFWIKIKKMLGEDLLAAYIIVVYFFYGFPGYLLFGASGGHDRGTHSHFWGPNKLFPKDKMHLIAMSNLGILAVIYALYLWAQAVCWSDVICVYIGPYLVANGWLTYITWLQHTDIDVPHYDEQGWDWLRGALGTIDRNYPQFIDHLHHYIGTTHVLHHLFSEIPFYNAKEANIYLKKVLGEYYNDDPRPLFQSVLSIASLVTVDHKGKGVWKWEQ